MPACLVDPKYFAFLLGLPKVYFDVRVLFTIRIESSTVMNFVGSSHPAHAMSTQYNIM